MRLQAYMTEEIPQKDEDGKNHDGMDHEVFRRLPGDVNARHGGRAAVWAMASEEMSPSCAGEDAASLGCAPETERIP